MSLDPLAKVPARYVGAHKGLLQAANGPYEDATGRRLESLLIGPGDTLRVYPAECWGDTLKWDPTGNSQPVYLGFGRVLLEQHAHPTDEDGTPLPPYTEAELAALGYEFRLPSALWEALAPPPDPDHEELAKLGLRAVQTAGIQVAPPGAVETVSALGAPSEAASVTTGRGKSRALVVDAVQSTESVVPEQV